MNKNQAVIIVTLLVLIVCAGVLAAKVNSPLYVNDSNFNTNDTSGLDSGNSTVNNTASNKTSNSTDTISKSNYFADSRLSRIQTDQKTLQELKSIIDDKNTTAQDRTTATQESIAITTDSTNDTKVENLLKGKGYKDALCTIENDKVTVVVKCNTDKLTDKQLREIKDVVISVTKLRNIEIGPPVND
jgi:stage III sporulation protein AH